MFEEGIREHKPDAHWSMLGRNRDHQPPLDTVDDNKVRLVLAVRKERSGMMVLFVLIALLVLHMWLVLVVLLIEDQCLLSRVELGAHLGEPKAAVDDDGRCCGSMMWTDPFLQCK